MMSMAIFKKRGVRQAISLFVFLFCSKVVLGLAQQDSTRVTPVKHTHAHNDYEHTRPLLDALDQGFTSVEADIYLKDGQMLIGHTASSLKPERTLEKLYLDPLRERARLHGGHIYKNGPPFYLLIDVKTAAEPTYRRLHEVLAQYGDILTTIERGKVETKAVTAVVSGNRDKPGMREQKVRFAGIDGRAADLNETDPASLMPWISDRWGSLFRWNGDGPMPENERARLLEIVQKTHAQGKQLRFWATPEKEAVWSVLSAAGVDWINTDKLAQLSEFLRKQSAK